MSYLILGCGSFAGQAIFSHLLANGFEVHGINRSRPKSMYMWPWIGSIEFQKYWHTLNLRDDISAIVDLVHELKPSYIIDFMGQGMVAQSWDDPYLWFDTNVSYKSRLLRSLSQLSSLRLYIRASTPEVFGSSAKPHYPEAPFNPSTPYAISHAAIDYYLRCIGKEYNFPYIIARYANFYGVGQQLYRVIPKLILSCLTNRRFVLDGGGSSLRSFIYADDIISSLICIIKHAEPFTEYHFSSEEEVSISQLTDMICKITNVERETIVTTGPPRQGLDHCYRLDTQKSLGSLGWKPSIELKTGLHHTHRWINNNLRSLMSEDWTYQHRT